MGHLNDVIVAAGLVGVPTLAAATIALAVYGQRRGARLYRKYAEADIDTVLDRASSEKAGA
ncbi:hypothetical protein OH802_09750 [Nocardioides sp. NBC_00850]|uniref:hypothetical protein n=1 Tax=Nocardioides sp. NBC_00850 TaxID=2976001 RepID=UPI00386A0585|nr:hypothetical protein OH802_09750 [Nocardioides sp. NBC_00850]